MRKWVHLTALLALLGTLAGPTAAFGSEAAGGHLSPPTTVAASGPPPVIYDSDMDFDDASTLAFLCQEHKQGTIRLLAVTVNNDGMGVPGRAATHARSVLRLCGLPHVPVADGSDTGVNPPPPEAQELFETILTRALDDADVPARPSKVPAPKLIANILRLSPIPVSVLATGPLSNLAAAIDSHPAVRHSFGRLQVMGGAFGVPGNLFGSTSAGFDNTQEFNMWLDPPSTARVLSAVRAPVSRIVPLDATNVVPITQEYVDTLGATATTAEARLVHAIVSSPELAPLIGQGNVLYWWDLLAALSMTRRSAVVLFREAPVSVIVTGESAGRTVVDPDGVPQLIGHQADRTLFEQAFLRILNGQSAPVTVDLIRP